MFKLLIESECGTLSEYFRFQSVPVAGDIVFVAIKDNTEVKLRVKLVEHYPLGSNIDREPPGEITLQCERLEH